MRELFDGIVEYDGKLLTWQVELSIMNIKWKQRIGHAALPICSVLGVLAAFGIVLTWFPKTWDAWNLPLQEIDAPAHYYFIRKLLRQGVGAAMKLWPNDAYYPPLFHILAAAVISFGNVIHVKINIYAAFNIVWLVTSGLVWPAGVSLWASYFTRKIDGKFIEGWRGLESAVHVALSEQKRKAKSDRRRSRNMSSAAGAQGGSAKTQGKKEGNWDAIVDSNSMFWRPFSCAMMLIVPLLSVASASHPFQMLASGPLIAFGLATSILPFWLYVTLRLFDAIADRYQILRWLILTVLLALLCVFAHPRIAFTWLLLMAPFMLMRLPWKAMLGVLVAVVVCAVAFFFYMTGHYHSSRYGDPSSWFHTYKPNRTVPQALQIFFSDNISGAFSGFMSVVVIVALVVAIVVVFGYLKSRLVIIRFDGRSGNKGGKGDKSSKGDKEAKAVSVESTDSVVVSDDSRLADSEVSDGSQSQSDEENVPASVATDTTDASVASGVAGTSNTSAASVAGSKRSHNSAHRATHRSVKTSRFATATPTMAKDAVSLLLAFALVCLVYVCSTSLTGWFPNIVTAAWYRAEIRPLTMIPFAIIPLLVFAACSVVYSFDGVDESYVRYLQQRAHLGTPHSSGRHAMAPKHPAGSAVGDWFSRNGGKAVSIVVLAALAVSCQFGNVNRQNLGTMIASNVVLDGKPVNEQLTLAKVDVLKQTVKMVGNGPVIISDPLNGSMYGSAMFDANMLYPVYNPMHEKNGAIFGQTENAFASGDPAKLTATTCPIEGNVPKYFLSMGPQAPSLQMFSFRQQYDTFHRQDLIDGYVRAGVLVKIVDFSYLGPYAKDWALYSIKCGQ